ncbi:type II secretion system protein [bacterium]|nr:type II secretion system protein [bacterium]
MNKKFIAFTLAEVLLVLSIVGVVGALTLPNLKKSYGKNKNVARVKSAYTKLDSALKQIDMNAVLGTQSNVKDRSLPLLTAMADYLKLTTNCGNIVAETSPCFPVDKFVDPSGKFTNGSPTFKGKCSAAIMNDGTEFAVCITSRTAEEDANSHNNIRGRLFIDVDGHLNGSNRRGEDIFVFEVGENGLELIQQNGHNTSTNTYKLEDAIFLGDD